MKVSGLSCLLVNSTRSAAYIQKLVQHNLLPESVLFVELAKGERVKSVNRYSSELERAVDTAFSERKYLLYGESQTTELGSEPQLFRTFDPEVSPLTTARKAGIEVIHLRANSVNDPAVVSTLAQLNSKYIVFGGGGILRKEILAIGKKLIHVHPGFIPNVRGSMAIEWSILLEGRCAASAFFMVEGIDEGAIIARRHFDAPPLENNNIPALYSSHIRSELLVEIVKRYAETGEFSSEPQDVQAGQTFYKMHPALSEIAFSRCPKNERSST